MDLVDNKQVDWVEIRDTAGDKTQRFAVERYSHLLARSTITSVDPTYN